MPNTSDDTRTRPASGRAQRRLRAVDALIDLVLESGAAPTPEDVAARAGISRATFFRYFSTLDELRGQAATRVIERYPELMTIPAIGAGSRRERIDRFVDARLELWERLHPLAFLLRAIAAQDAGSAAFVDAGRQVLADQVRQHFSTDLRRHSGARRDETVVAIAVLTSVESWQHFRRSHDMSSDATRRAWRRAITSILTAPDADR